MRHFTLTILATFATASGASAGEMLAELRADRLDYFLNASFSRYGLEPLKTIGLERSGVHFRINHGTKTETQTGVYSHFSLKGDFEFLADYEVLNLSKPTAGYGMSLGIAAHTAGPVGSVFLTRSHHQDWGTCLIATREVPVSGGKPEYTADSFPTAARKGRLGLRRVGSEIVLLAGDAGKEFVELKRLPFTAEPITQLRIYADTGGAETAVEGRFTNIVIRAESIDGAPVPPDGGTHWTTYLLLASCAVGVAGGLIYFRRWRANRDQD